MTLTTQRNSIHPPRLVIRFVVIMSRHLAAPIGTLVCFGFWKSAAPHRIIDRTPRLFFWPVDLTNLSCVFTRCGATDLPATLCGGVRLSPTQHFLSALWSRVNLFVIPMSRFFHIWTSKVFSNPCYQPSAFGRIIVSGILLGLLASATIVVKPIFVDPAAASTACNIRIVSLWSLHDYTAIAYD